MTAFDINALKEAWTEFPADSKFMLTDLSCELSLSFGHINDIEITIYAADDAWIDVYEFLCLVGKQMEWLPGDLYPDGAPEDGPEGFEALTYRIITAAELREKLTDKTLADYSMDALIDRLLLPETATAIWLKYHFWDYKEFVLQYPDRYRYVCVQYMY
jgi:hypothetical protein